MTKVTRDTKWKRTGGLNPKRVAQKSHATKAAEAIVKAIATGKKYIEIGCELYVPCAGEFVEWGKADPTKIGR